MTSKNFQEVVLVFILFLFISCGSSNQTTSSTQKTLNLYETLPDASEKKTLYGIISKELITQDTTFGWYQANLKYYKADSSTVQTIRAKKNNLHLVLFCGTCVMIRNNYCQNILQRCKLPISPTSN